jgi:ABC-2 type transport system ATP-binding protein
LHRPGVLFLDEPTIGLDITMQRRIRVFVGEYCRRHGATVLLTSHYMADVEALCRRVIVIHHGRLLFDGELDALAARFATHKTVGLRLDGTTPLDVARTLVAGYGELLDVEPETDTFRLSIDRADAPRVAAQLLAHLPVVDVTIEDPPIEDVIEQVFADARADDEAR